MNGKYVSCQEIIRNVLRDSDVQNQDFNWQDLVEYAAEAVELIGAPKSLTRDIACVTIDNYRGLLPCNFYEMTQCSGSINGSTQFPMRTATGSFHPVFTCQDPVVSPSQITIIDQNNPIGEDSQGNPVFQFQSGSVDILPAGITPPPLSLTEDAVYKLNDNFILTNFKTGRVYMAYKAFPVDADGFPLIPDNIKFRKAVQAYIQMKVDYKLWRKNQLEKAVFQHSEAEWLWYVGAAQSADRMPTSADELESWKNITMRLMPRLDEHTRFFRNLGNQEQLTFGKRFFYNGFNAKQL